MTVAMQKSFGLFTARRSFLAYSGGAKSSAAIPSLASKVAVTESPATATRQAATFAPSPERP